jgi:hypothetical protein
MPKQMNQLYSEETERGKEEVNGYWLMGKG